MMQTRRAVEITQPRASLEGLCSRNAGIRRLSEKPLFGILLTASGFAAAGGFVRARSAKPSCNRRLIGFPAFHHILQQTHPGFDNLGPAARNWSKKTTQIHTTLYLSLQRDLLRCQEATRPWFRAASSNFFTNRKLPDLGSDGPSEA